MSNTQHSHFQQGSFVPLDRLALRLADGYGLNKDPQSNNHFCPELGVGGRN
jgi:hypothetical protein